VGFSRRGQGLRRPQTLQVPSASRKGRFATKILDFQFHLQLRVGVSLVGDGGKREGGLDEKASMPLGAEGGPGREALARHSSCALSTFENGRRSGPDLNLASVEVGGGGGARRSRGGVFVGRPPKTLLKRPQPPLVRKCDGSFLHDLSS